MLGFTNHFSTKNSIHNQLEQQHFGRVHTYISPSVNYLHFPTLCCITRTDPSTNQSRAIRSPVATLPRYWNSRSGWIVSHLAPHSWYCFSQCWFDNCLSLSTKMASMEEVDACWNSNVHWTTHTTGFCTFTVTDCMVVTCKKGHFPGIIY